jgi:hypothetical protein
MPIIKLIRTAVERFEITIRPLQKTVVKLHATFSIIESTLNMHKLKISVCTDRYRWNLVVSSLWVASCIEQAMNSIGCD